MEEVIYLKKKQQNQQLLILFRKLEDLEESCWTKLLRFQKSQYFVQFQKKYSVPNIITLRLDDFIYLLLLIIQEVIFGLLPIDSSSYFTTPYRQSLALFFLATFIVLISPHWFRWLTLILFCLGYPILLYLTFNGIINLMPVDNSTAIFSYMGYLTLIPIFVLLVFIYPIKQYIRNIAGSIYSYIYGLSLTLILYLWPLYSFIQSGSFSFSFVTNNQPLMISFIVMIITGFYFFIHHTLFQIKLEKIKKILLEDFTEGQLTQALEQTQEEYQQKQKLTCIHQNFTVFVRCMSFIIYSIVLVSEIFLFLQLANDFSKISTVGPIMGYILIFILFGAFFIYIPISKQVFIPIISILSISSALASFLYYKSSTSFTDYAIVSLSFPSFAIFWSLVKLISIKKPILRTNLIIGFYIVIQLPAMALVMNIYKIFTSDQSLISTLNYTFYSAIIVTLLILLVAFIVWQVSKKKKEEPKQQQKARIPVDYNYSEQGNPSYQHYQISKLGDVTYISNVDLRDTGYIFCMLIFILSQLMAVHAVNQLNTTFATTAFYSQSIKQVIYSQFYIILIFYIYSHSYLASKGDTAKYFFLPYFLLTCILFLFAGFALSVGNTTLKIIGGFSLIMVFIVIAFEALKSFAKNMFGFISTIIAIVIWIFIVFPYVVLIPFVSIYVDQTKFGTFVYGCILGTIVLLILLVGILTLLFNRLIDKYQQEKKYKFMTEDVLTLFQEEGVQAEDETLHILYQSFLYRDKKYVFFLKRGFPLNLLKDPSDEITKLVTSQDYKLKRIPTKKQINSEKQRKQSYLWICLTCCCGEDEEDIDQKLKKAKKKIDKQQLQSLLPKSLMSGLIKPDPKNIPKNKKKLINPNKVFSSKSLILKDLHSGPRYLGDQYILLKTNKKADLAIQIWHSIFQFAANQDQIEPLIICNDFSNLFEAVGINQISKTDFDQIFHQFARKKWKGHSGMDLQDFALAVQCISEKLYSSQQIKIPQQQRKYYLLIDKVYYNLSSYEEFNNFNFEKRKTKKSIKNTPFKTSFKRYQQFLIQDNNEKEKLIERVKVYDRNKLFQPRQQSQIEVYDDSQNKTKEKGKSCKKILFQKLKQCQRCCKKQESRDQIQKKLFVKPWNLLSVDAVKILQRKQIEWSSQVTTKQHPFRITSNNILMAAFKLIDLYTYISISILNPKLQWLNSYGSSSFLYTDYSIQTFLAGAVVLVSVPLGIKGIMLIFEDRLGLTQNRLPATFPHPMFFFTFIYKLMILSLFNIISQTFLDTFNCNWTSSSTTTYTLTDDTSIQCFSDVHNRFILISLVGILLYYPLSSYAMPNFQFAQKSLDLKYRSSYLILYFQVNFALLSGKVLLSTSSTTSIQIIYNAINIFALSLLAFSVISIQPCLITWFNYVEFMVISIGIIVNVLGLVLYITNLWMLCVIAASAGCLLLIIFVVLFIRQRFFKKQIHSAQVQQDQNVQQLEMMWQAKLKKEKRIIEFQEKNKAGVRLQSIGPEDENDNSSDDKTKGK